MTTDRGSATISRNGDYIEHSSDRDMVSDPRNVAMKALGLRTRREDTG
jgi:hypothetical protein